MPLDKFNVPSGAVFVFHVGLVTYVIAGHHIIKIGPGDPPEKVAFRRILDSVQALVQLGHDDPAISSNVFALADNLLKKAAKDVPELVASSSKAHAVAVRSAS